MSRESEYLLKQASYVLRNGDKQMARKLASEAASLDSEDEKPWILLGMIASPRASLEYFSKALGIAPKSKRAKKGLHWAVQRSIATGALDKKKAKSYLTQARHTNKLGVLGGRVLIAITTSSLILFLGVSLIAADIIPGLRDSVVAYAKAPIQPSVDNISEPPLLEISLTTLPTAMPTTSPTATMVPSNTPIPSLTATMEPTPLPHTATPSVILPAGADAQDNWIDVDLTKQRLDAYQGTVLIRTFIVSTGTWEHPTVTGQYQIYVKYEAAPMSGPGYYLPGVPYIMYFYRGYGIHGTYWHNNFGTPMSHGCVNMTIEDSSWMFNFAKIGTWINIHY